MSNKQQIYTLIQKQRWQDAQKSCTQFCNANPNDAEAWFLLGAILGQVGAFAESEVACRRSLALRTDMPMTLCNLGIALRQQDKPVEAISTFGQVLKLKPDFAQAYSELGSALQMHGQLDEAIEHFRRALSFNPTYAQAAFNIATVFAAQGKPADAVTALQQAIKLSPLYVEAHSLLGQLLRGLKRLDEAIVHFRQALKVRPGDAYIWNALGGALMDRLSSQDAFSEAEKCYREAIRHQPNIPEFYLNLAVLLREQGGHDEALKLLQKAVELRPGYETAIAGISQVLEYKGDFDGAYATVRPLLEQGTAESTVALAYAAVARHINQRDAAIALLEKIVLLPKPAHELRAMHFALGKLYDSMKEYDKSFQHSAAAHSVEPAAYDPEKNKRNFDARIEVFSAENLARLPRSSYRAKLPVFIVGMPRSGTSLVEQILASHPQVYGAGELGDVHRMTLTLPAMLGGKIAYPQCVLEAKRKHLDEIAQRHLAMLGKFSKSATRVTDKMPHNFLELGLIELLFPDAQIIHCMRDPIDTCYSIYGLSFNASHPYTDRLDHLGAYYLEYLRLMEHWKAVLSLPILEVQYEELVADQERISRQMVEFCGLPWDERCLNFHEAERVVTTHSYDQVRRPIYKQSVARWKNYERHLGPLLDALNYQPKSHARG